MTNEQIIYEIAVQLYGDAAVQRMIEEDGEIPLHTVQGWAQRGPYKIKKGEHGIETRLWRKKKKSEVEGEKAERKVFCKSKTMRKNREILKWKNESNDIQRTNGNYIY